MRRILVTGANGQLGSAMRLLGAMSRNEYRFTDVAELDITDEEAVRRAVCDGRIDVIVNRAAYTNVDRAEEDEAAADRINRLAVGNLARAAAAADATLIHVSTDYVFWATPTGPTTRRAKRTRSAFTAGRSWRVKRRSNKADANRLLSEQHGFIRSSDTTFSKRCCALRPNATV